jgi:hypothetical protein
VGVVRIHDGPFVGSEAVSSGLVGKSELHRAKWVDDSLPIELVWPNARPPTGMRTYDYRLPRDEFVEFDGMRITSLERTAFDLGRRRGDVDPVARLDALGNATPFRVAHVDELSRRHRGARGLRRLETALDLHDPGAESPKETWLRLLLIDAGFPRPQTQIPVLGPDGKPLCRLDMGWEDLMEYLHGVGWLVVRVVTEHRRREIVRRVRDARASRLR